MDDTISPELEQLLNAKKANNHTLSDVAGIVNFRLGFAICDSDAPSTELYQRIKSQITVLNAVELEKEQRLNNSTDYSDVSPNN